MDEPAPLLLALMLAEEDDELELLLLEDDEVAIPPAPEPRAVIGNVLPLCAFAFLSALVASGGAGVIEISSVSSLTS